VKPRLKVVEKAKPGTLPAPSWLSDSAREEWDRVAPVLRARGRLTPEVEGLVATYCAAVATVREAEAAMAREGFTVTGPGGVTRAHPMVGPKNRAAATVLQLAKRLGLLTDAPPDKGGGDDDPYADLGVR
jgi:P27 family predicted phage terminase small subunit